jgi:cytochrome b6-f complex iron-sulfur subunit
MVEALLAGEALPSGRLEADEVEALRTAIELRAARPAADLPEEEFVTGLRRRLAASSSDDRDGSRSRVPRRVFLAGAAGAVAAGLVGALAESALSPASSPHPAAAGEVVPDAGQWVPVATVSGVEGGQVQRFATATTVGFVTEQNGALSAVTGVCSHQGCLLQLNRAAGRLDCPCHRTAFALDGAVMFSQLSTRPSALPEIRVRSREGQVEAFLAPEA